jgi:hypothetical protein
MRDKIKYIAAYRSQPESKVTHYAPVASIEPYGEEGKYKLIFAAPAKPIGPIPFGDAPSGAMQGPRYTTLQKPTRGKEIDRAILRRFMMAALRPFLARGPVALRPSRAPETQPASATTLGWTVSGRTKPASPRP